MVKKDKQSANKWNILIAEDDLKSRADLLKALGTIANCTSVDDGEKALKIYRQSLKKKKPFDFILLDVTIPTLSGFDILKAIRTEEEARENAAKNSRIIMITAYKDSLMKLYNMGWDDYISKPIDAHKLIQRMRAIVSKK